MLNNSVEVPEMPDCTFKTRKERGVTETGKKLGDWELLCNIAPVKNNSETSSQSPIILTISLG